MTTTEDKLKSVLESGVRDSGEFDKQIGEFRALEKRLSEAGVGLRQERYSVPLMARIESGRKFKVTEKA